MSAAEIPLKEASPESSSLTETITLLSLDHCLHLETQNSCSCFLSELQKALQLGKLPQDTGLGYILRVLSFLTFPLGVFPFSSPKFCK